MLKNSDMTGKVVLVTGATNGIGQVTARSLAAMGSTVVVSGRDPQRTNASVQLIRSQTGSEPGGWTGCRSLIAKSDQEDGRRFPRPL